MARVTVSGSTANNNKDILAVSICEAVPTNNDTQTPDVVTYKLQEADYIDGEDAEADGEVVEQYEQSTTANEINNSSSLCPQHALVSAPSSCDGLTKEVPTGAAVEDSAEQEQSAEIQQKVTYKKRRRRKKAAKWMKKKVAVKKKQNVVPLSLVDTTTNDMLDDTTNNQRDKEESCDQRGALDDQTDQSDDQTEDDQTEAVHREGLGNQKELGCCGELTNQRRLDNQKEGSDGQVEGLDEQTEIDKIGNQRELIYQSKELADQKGLENQQESDGQVEGIDDQVETDKLDSQRKSFEKSVNQSKELADQTGLEDQTEQMDSRIEGLDDHVEVSQREGNQSDSLVDQNEELHNQSGLEDQREQSSIHQILENQREDSDGQTERNLVLHDQEGSVTRKDDTTPAITTTADSSDTPVTNQLQDDNSGMEAVDITSKDSLPAQTPIDKQAQLPYMQQASPSASCHENEASPKTSQSYGSALAMRQEIDEHSKDSNVTTMSFEGQKQCSAEKQPSAQGKNKKGLSKKKKGRRKRPKKAKPQTVLVQEKKWGRGRPKKVVMQEVPDSTAGPDDSTVSKQEENNDKSPEPFVSSTCRVDEVSPSHDVTMTVTQDDQQIGTEPAHPASSPPDVVTSTSSDANENITTCNVLPDGGSNTTTGSSLPSDRVVAEVTGDIQPSPCNTDKIVNRLGKKPSYRGLRKRQSVVVTVSSATKKLKFDNVEIKHESGADRDSNEGTIHFPITPSVGPTEPTMKRKRGKSTMATVKSEVTSSSPQETVVTRVAPGAAPLTTVNRWAYQ